MSVIRDAVDSWKSRLTELEKEIAPLADEAEQLRTAIARLEAIEPAGRGARAQHGARQQGAHGAPRRAHVHGQRAPRGENRRLILAAIKNEAKTAGDVAKETGIGRPTVSTTLTKLVSDGVAVKAQARLQGRLRPASGAFAQGALRRLLAQNASCERLLGVLAERAVDDLAAVLGDARQDLVRGRAGGRGRRRRRCPARACRRAPS